MSPEIRNPQSAIRNRWLQWLSRGFFAAAVLAAGYGMWLKRAAPLAQAEAVALRKAPVAIDWTREEFREWSSAEDGISLRYPARFDAVRGFGRFTSRDVEGGIEQTDVVSFRAAEPRAVIVIAAYRAPRALAWKEWVSLATAEPPPPNPRHPTPGAFPQIGRKLPPSPFTMEFGGSQREFRQVKVGSREALAVSAEGAVKYPIRGNEQWELWRFESRLIVRGDRAVRITAGVHSDHADGARAGLEQTLESFRWNAR